MFKPTHFPPIPDVFSSTLYPFSPKGVKTFKTTQIKQRNRQKARAGHQHLPVEHSAIALCYLFVCSSIQLYIPFSPQSLFHLTLGSGESGSQLSIPITKLGEKKYYLGIFFKVKTLSPKFTRFMFERKIWKSKPAGYVTL